MAETFNQLLQKRWDQGKFLCIGLDPQPDDLPLEFSGLKLDTAIFRFCRTVVTATAPFAAAFKPNMAFYEQLGPSGLVVLRRLGGYIKTNYPEIPLILDGKRGDIFSTNKQYAKMVFDYYQADATTVQPYVGLESLQPFIDYQERGVFILVKTSNPDSYILQDLQVHDPSNHAISTVSTYLARRINHYYGAGNTNLGLVIGATYPHELAALRKIAPAIPFLIPGVGAQGGDLNMAVRYGLNQAKQGILINAGRSIMYAGANKKVATFEAAASEAKRLAAEISRVVDETVL
jgi:orotidine-5'-phosphate decarboxylase